MLTKSSGEIGRQRIVNEASLVIILHQAVFQGCFFLKNRHLSRKLKAPVRGRNPEARRAILFFVLFILSALFIAASESQFARWPLLPEAMATVSGLLLLALNMIFGLASLRDLGESWRVGILQDQATPLVEDGIYRFSRNPYFVAYLLMFAGYTVLLQNLLLLGLSCFGFLFIHNMILREETFLEDQHGQAYRSYRSRVPRYLLV